MNEIATSQSAQEYYEATTFKAKSKKRSISIMIATVVMLVSCQAQSATCYIDDNEGGRWYRNIKTKTGAYPKTLGYVSASKPCMPAIGLRVEVSREEAICMSTALNYCDAKWGGIKLQLNPTIPNSDNQCIFMMIKPTISAENGTNYATPILYDNWKVGADGVKYCPQ